MPSPSKNSLLKAGLAAVITISGATIPGCNFFQARSIRDESNNIVEADKKRTKEIRDIEKRLFEEYKAADQVEIRDYVPRAEPPSWANYADGKSTLFFRVAYGDTAAITEGLTKHFSNGGKNPYPIINSYPKTHQLIITVDNDDLRRKVEDQLFVLDRAPRQVELRISIAGELSDNAQDFSSQLELLLKNQGDPSVAVSSTAYIPGSELRVADRSFMSNRWGVQLAQTDFTLQAYLDYMKHKGFATRFYEREMTLTDTEIFKVGKEEKLPITAFIQNGLQTIVTDNLVDVLNSVEVTPSIKDGYAVVTFKAVIGSSKRADLKRRILTPQKETIEMNNVYLDLGRPYSAAGIVENIKIGTVRKGFFPWPSGEDTQHTVNRLWCTVTPEKLILYNPRKLIWPFPGSMPEYLVSPELDPNSLFPQIKDPNSYLGPIRDSNSVSLYSPPKHLIKPA